MAYPRRPVLAAAMIVDPEPEKQSSTISPRLVTSRIASARSPTGLGVGCSSSSLRKLAAPGQGQTLVLVRPNRPSCTLFTTGDRESAKTKHSSCWLRHRLPIAPTPLSQTQRFRYRSPTD